MGKNVKLESHAVGRVPKGLGAKLKRPWGPTKRL